MVGNALKFIGPSGRVEYGVTIEEKDQKKNFIFYVKDNGIGIPEDKHQVIFERFQQVFFFFFSSFFFLFFYNKNPIKSNNKG